MHHRTFTWGRSKKQYRLSSKLTDGLWVVGLLAAAVLLFSINLGELPLRDWDEGTVAQVAREIWQSPPGAMHWLYPTLRGEPYYNKPPLVHLLIASAYSVWGVSEWTARLPGAMLTAISVPLLYLIGRELFSRRAAVYSALIYMTLLPVVRHGRLAMLDGAVICFFLLMLLCVLRSRRDLRYCLGIGIGFGLICLTKGIIGILLLAIALVFLLWDTPRLLKSGYLWSGILIGSVPVALWYGLQWWHYGKSFTHVGMVDQSLSRIWQSVEAHSGPPWYYLLQIAEYAWPWLLFLPAAGAAVWENRNLSWAKLLLVWSSGYLLSISLMETKLPWYVLPIYPCLALASGFGLARATDGQHKAYPRYWMAGLVLLSVVACIGGCYFTWSAAEDGDLQLLCAAVALTMGLTAIMLSQKDTEFLTVLFWGCYVSLLLLMTSNHWVWELAENYPVQPVAQMIRDHTLKGEKIYTDPDNDRPSLNFYSERPIKIANNSQMQQHWRFDDQPYLLIEQDTLTQLNLTSVKLLGKSKDLLLITKNNH